MSVETNSPPAPRAVTAKVALLKALADTSRLTVVSALAERPHCVEELAQRLGRAASTISFHLRKLDEAGLVTRQRTQYYVVYALRADLFDLTLRQLVTTPDGSADRERKRLEKVRKDVLRTFIKGGVLTQLPKQWRKRRFVLEVFLDKFEPGRIYPEREVDERIHTMFDDHCTIRRLLVDEGYMTRQGGSYRRVGASSSEHKSMGDGSMETNKELKRKYLETPKRAGVFQVRNVVDNKVLLGSSTNLHGPLNKHRFMLSTGAHDNAALQADWKRLGPDAFAFEELEVVKVKDDPAFSLEDELTLLEELWLEKLSPMAPHGYNTNRRIRE